ncbi:MAG TPA: sulfotransferase [Nitrospirota bacterium]|nr:sulfotransferase [Nitrospirota bacterium]
MMNAANHRVKIKTYTRLMNWYRWSNLYIPLLNPSARLVLKLKYYRDKAVVRQQCKLSESELNNWFRSKIVFFGFAYPRSGTVFLANLLINEVRDALIEHEANIVDYWHYTLVIQSEDKALDYIKNFRKQEIFLRVAQGVKIYGEINPTLRIHCKAIKQLIPGARLFHIVRDGRDVVRSIMSRENLGEKDPLLKLTRPPREDAYREAWDHMSRFEKVCWQWQFDNRFIRKNVGHHVLFEKMKSDYDYFTERINNYLDIDIPEKAWYAYVNKPQNVSRHYALPHWNKWDHKMRDDFDRICGEEMRELGYPI